MSHQLCAELAVNQTFQDRLSLINFHSILRHMVSIQVHLGEAGNHQCIQCSCRHIKDSRTDPCPHHHSLVSFNYAKYKAMMNLARFGGRPMPMPPPHMHPMFPGHPAHFGKHPPYGHPMFVPPPPPHFAYSPPHQRAAPTVPIIESIYDTYPRRGGYEESIYMPTNGTLPPNSTYRPSGPYDQYEGFYETYKRPGKANGMQQTDSDNTSVEDSQFW
jgi:hypothetical protein